MTYNNLTNEQVLQEITRRVKQLRLNQNITQGDLAKRSGVHVQTIKNFESGKSTKVMTLIQILRAFGELNALDTFIPDPGISPIELLKLKGKERERASGSLDSKKDESLW